jgi:two-component system cell cycle sensor histidine kinase/response regulator CckA
VLELDEKRRIRRLSGDPQLLSGASADLIGQSLDSLMNGPQGEGRTLSELAAGSIRNLVVVRDSQDLRKVRRRLQQLELQYRGLCDGAHDLIVLLEPEGNLIFSNRALLHQLGGVSPCQIQELFSSTGLESVKEHLHNALLEGKSTEFESQLSSGVPVSGSFSALAADPASPLTVLGIFRDLSAQRAAEANLRQAQKMEAVGRLAGGVAHDMNNFLSIFSGLIGLIREDRHNPEMIEEYLGEADQAMASATELVKQLLHFTRKRNQERQEFELDPAVAEIARMASRLLGRGIDLETSLHSQNRVWGERAQLDQVILNLLVNARDAMPQGGRVRLTSRALKGWSELQVCDEGSGMDEQTAARIFEPYFTTKEMGKGTGLGLSTVYVIVHAWGGRLTVESRPGQGTTFTILLPCV